ncbi:MAG: 2-oxoglutarate synthase [Dehalococcoidia bacterium]|nr:2-oxoglutarate synthase [Dehalococcoidia bacterium]
MSDGWRRFLRPGVNLPFCPGCGHRLLLRHLLTAIDELGLDIDGMLFVSGIGCGGWIPSPCINADTLHCLHGRAIPFAIGAKLANPRLTTLVVSGDGDLADIGGNHLIHAARRNHDITVICANNMNYGMTGGQVCSTTPLGATTHTTPKGNVNRPFDLCALVRAAGAQYAARFLVTQGPELVAAIKKAISTPGFTFVEAISPCPTQFGRQNRKDSVKDAYAFVESMTVSRDAVGVGSGAADRTRLVTGEFCDE